MTNVLTSPDGQALLNAVIQNPDDDTPRLVFADWLEEHGDPDRAAFTRLQCQAARLPEGEEKERVAAAADGLLERHRPAWLADLGHGFTNPVFDRGFVAGVMMTVEEFLAHAGRLLDRTPLDWVRVAALTGDGVRRLAASPLLGRVPRLDIAYHRIGTRGALVLAESPHLKQLRGINLEFNEIGEAGVRAILDGLAGGRTTEINLSLNRLGPKGAAAIADSPAAGSVTDLLLTYAHIGGRGDGSTGRLPPARRPGPLGRGE